MVNPIRVGIIAGAITLVIFLSGIWFGMEMQNQRELEIKDEYNLLQISWNDIKLQSELIQKSEQGTVEFCNIAIEENLKFGEQVYEKGKKIEDYEQRNEFNENLLIEKKEHNLLKLQFWINSINIKSICEEEEYINLIYLYKNNAHGLDEIKQNQLSEILFQIKQDNGAKIMLIPIAINLELGSVETALAKYNIEETPSILINENVVIAGVPEQKDIQKIIDEQLF